MRQSKYVSLKEGRKHTTISRRLLLRFSFGFFLFLFLVLCVIILTAIGIIPKAQKSSLSIIINRCQSSYSSISAAAALIAGIILRIAGGGRRLRPARHDPHPPPFLHRIVLALDQPYRLLHALARLDRGRQLAVAAPA